MSGKLWWRKQKALPTGVKSTTRTLFLVAITAALALLVTERIVTLRSPEMMQLARLSPHPLASVTFQSSGSGNTISGRHSPLSSAFWAVFVHPENNTNFAQKLDFALSTLLTEMDMTQDEGEKTSRIQPDVSDDFSSETAPPEEPLDEAATPNTIDPIRILAEEIFSGPFLTFSGALKLDLSAFQKLILAGLQIGGQEQKLLSPYLTSLFPTKVQHYFLSSEDTGSVFFSATRNPQSGVHHAVVTLTSHDIDAFIDGICADSPPSEVCHSLGLDSPKVLEQLAKTLEFLGEDFEMRIDLYWLMRGTTLIWSTQEEWITSLFLSRDAKTGTALSGAAPQKDTSVLEVGFSPRGAFTPTQSAGALSLSDKHDSFSASIDLAQLFDSYHFLLAVMHQREEDKDTPLSSYLQTPRNEERFNEWDDDLNRQSKRFEKFVLRWTKETTDFLPELWFGNIETSFLKQKIPLIGTDGKSFLGEILQENNLIQSLSTVSTLQKIPRLKASQFNDWIRLSTELNEKEFATLWKQLFSSVVNDTHPHKTKTKDPM